MLSASWIWKQQRDLKPRHQIVVFRRKFRAGKIEKAEACITVDGAYRLFVNDAWVADGPCRSYPQHRQYDVLDLKPYLQRDQNEIRIVARHWSVGTFHAIPQQVGLLFELELTESSGDTRKIVSDNSWEVAEAQGWIAETPKVSVQMEPQEIYDARATKRTRFGKVQVLGEATEGPWQDLNPRDVPLLTRDPVAFRKYGGTRLVRKRDEIHYCSPTAWLAHPGLTEANHNVSNAGGMATMLHLEAGKVVHFESNGFLIHINGKHREDGRYRLKAGSHLMTAFVAQLPGHEKEKWLRIVNPPEGMRLKNPLEPDHENPWCHISLQRFAFADNDLNWISPALPQEHRDEIERYADEVWALGATISDLDALRTELADMARCLPSRRMFLLDTYWRFQKREEIRQANELVENPACCFYDNADRTTVHPGKGGDVEMVLDCGKQTCGYWHFDLEAPAGTEMDLYAVEYIDEQGRIQHTDSNRNGLTYITREGTNRFTSLKRRAGRYLFLTLRNQTAPVHIRHIGVIESTYPVEYVGDFECSDPQLANVYEISARTLKLCMEDTFTDCPLYEQTLWVGDARNESLFAYPVFGSTDLARRCIRIGAQSLEHYPIVGCQVPSSWDCLLPAWSFLWGISVWDYYFYTGDKAFLEEYWQPMVHNIEGAEQMRDEHGMFSAPFWNLFDWAGIDDGHETVLHNTMLLIGCINAAMDCARVLEKSAALEWLDQVRERFVTSVNKFWDPERQAYPDSIHADGTPSKSISIHTSFLAVLYNIVPQKQRAAAIRNMTNPPEDMVRIGSPFAMLYHYEALEQIGLDQHILDNIYESYLPMLRAGATTVWEVFPNSAFSCGVFPTRSHCHAWSSAPVYFLNRIVLGLRATEPGGTRYIISPRATGISWARGTVVTSRGPLTAEWHLEGDDLHVTVEAPAGVRVEFAPNETIATMNSVLNLPNGRGK